MEHILVDGKVIYGVAYTSRPRELAPVCALCLSAPWAPRHRLPSLLPSFRLRTTRPKVCSQDEAGVD